MNLSLRRYDIVLHIFCTKQYLVTTFSIYCSCAAEKEGRKKVGGSRQEEGGSEVVREKDGKFYSGGGAWGRCVKWRR